MRAPDHTSKAKGNGAARRQAGTTSTRPVEWAGMGRLDRAAVALTVTLLAALTIPRLPPGVCFGDSGGLQLASATLGITHPPGYAGYASLGYVLTRVPRMDPAYVVSLACLGTGLLVVLLCILWQVRLGVMPAIACAVALAFTAHPSLWGNMVAPEVYMPSLALLAGAAYLLVKYARLGAWRDLLLAAILFGVVLANRPPVVLVLPFLLIGWWLARRRWDTSWRQATGSFLLVAGLATLPTVYNLAYLWIRDTPSTPFNYIEQYNAEFHELPDTQAGWQAKLERVLWHATGRQFRQNLGGTWPQVRAKLRWLRTRLLPDRSATLAIAAILAVLGAVIAFRRCAVSAWLVLGMATGAIVFLCAYRVHGDAADFLPLLFSAGVLLGVALSPLFPPASSRYHRLMALALLLAVSVATVVDAPHRRHAGRFADATAFLDKVDLETLPDNAVIWSSWGTSPPLWYARNVLTRRSDIRIINAEPIHWPHLLEQTPECPTYVTIEPGDWLGHNGTSYRNLWRLE